METSKLTAAKNLVPVDSMRECEVTEWLLRNIRKGSKAEYYHRLLPRHHVYLFAPTRVGGGSGT